MDCTIKDENERPKVNPVLNFSDYEDSFDSSTTIDLSANQTVEITSPNYPSEYDNYENVVWTVTAPEGNVVYLEILESSVSPFD